MSQAAKKTHLLRRRLTKGAIALVIFLLLSCIMLIGTTFGARVLLSVAQKFSPITFQWQALQGSLYHGLSFDALNINQTTRLQQVHVQLHPATRTLSLHAKTVHLNTEASDAVLSLIPPLSNDTIHYLTLHDFDLHFQPLQSKAKLQTTYLQKRYQVMAQNNADRSLIQVHTDPKARGLTIHITSTDTKRFHVSADGQLLLPSGTMWHIKNTSITYANRMLQTKIALNSPTDHSFLKLHTSSKDPNTHQASLDFKVADTRIKGTGTLGKKSDFSLTVHNKDAHVSKHLKLKDSHLQVQIKGAWHQPQLSSTTSIAQIKTPSWQIDRLAATYDRNFATDDHFGNLQASVSQLLLNSDVSFQSLSLSSKHTDHKTYLTLLARQDQSQIKSQMLLSTKQDQVIAHVHDLSINQYALISNSSPQSVHLSKNRVTAKPGASPGILSFSGGFSYVDGIDLSIVIKQLDLKQIPNDSLKLLFPSLESLDGTVSGQWRYRHTRSAPGKIEGDFSVDIQNAYVMNLIGNLPLETSLHITGGTISGHQDNELALNGQLQGNRGTIDFTGHTTDHMRKFISHFDSKDIVFGYNTPSYVQLDAETDYIFSDEEWHCRSDIKIKKASYRLGFYQPVTYLPVETVIKHPDKSDTTGSRYHLDINLDLGDKTDIHVIGFHGLAKGKLHITSSDTTQTLASGELMLDHATLLIYKQTLPIQRMTLTWFNNPIILPNLDMRISAKGLRDIDGRDQMQQYGLRAYGSLDNLRFDYFSSPAPMNSFQVLIALLTDSSYTKKANYESLDRTLAYYNNDQKSSQLREILDILDAVKSIPFFDNVDISEINMDENNPNVPDISGITITKRLDRYFSLRYRLIPNSQRNNRISLDTNLSRHMILTNFIQNEGDVGVALNYFSSS